MVSKAQVAVPEAIQNLIISTSNVKSTERLLGRGSFGKVFEVEYDGKFCAAKEVHPWMSDFASKEERAELKEKFIQDCQIWSALHHPNLVQFLGIYYPSGDESGLPVMVMEKMQETLTSLVEKHDNIPLLVKLSILHDVSLGLSYLHSRNPPIIHRDLSSNKVLLSSHLEAKITDYGLAKATLIDVSKTMTKSLRATAFLPSEALRDNLVKVGPPVDVFCFAGIILHITSRQWPTPMAATIDPNEVGLSEVRRRQEYLDLITGDEVTLKPLAISCLANEDKRPLAAEISEEIKRMKELCSKKTTHDGKDPISWLAEIKEASSEASALKESTMPDLSSGSVDIKWKEGAPSPVFSVFHTAVLYNNAVYIGGGTGGTGTSHHLDGGCRIDVYHPTTNKWDNPVDTPQSFFGLTVLTNKLLIVGGFSVATDKPTKKVLVLQDGEWKDYTEMSTKRFCAVAVSHQEMMIVMGGKNRQEKLCSNTELLDDSTGQWFQCNDLPYPCAQLQSVVVGETLYILGGEIEPPPDAEEMQYSTAVYAAPVNTLSSHQLKWQRLSDVPHPRSSAVGLNSKYLLTVGGQNYTDTVSVLKSEEGSSTTSWKSIGSLPTVQSFPAVVNVNNQVITIGGIEQSSFMPSRSVHIGTFN